VKAQAAEKTDLDRALELYSAIPRESGEWYDRAQAQIARLRAEIARRPPKPTAAEQAAYDELLEFWRQNAGKHDELIRKGETFVATFPRGELRPAVEERIAHARQARLARRTEEAAEVEAAVTRCVERHDFAGAIQAIEKASRSRSRSRTGWSRRVGATTPGACGTPSCGRSATARSPSSPISIGRRRSARRRSAHERPRPDDAPSRPL
jgi:hypothetical protein